MNLRETLCHILPELLPQNPHEAIKGTELIARVRQVLGDAYSDQSLRSQFSFLALEEDSCLARIENGQGYYLRGADEAPSLHSMFAGGASDEAQSSFSKALALGVRLYDTTGMGVFVYPVDEEESWCYPDFAAVQWPSGRWEQGAYLFDADAQPEAPTYVAVCVAMADSWDAVRRAFFRALSCGAWAQQTELLLFGAAEHVPEDELRQLSAMYGVGVRCLFLGEESLLRMDGADVLFKAEAQEMGNYLVSLPQQSLSVSKFKANPPQEFSLRPEIQAVTGWAESCLRKGRVESYELRVAVN